jgi:UDP-N-acetylglucosamine 2-epimerase (non-hydrolysing)
MSPLEVPMKPVTVLNVVGARPNLVKMAPIVEAMRRHAGPIRYRLVHTGQHYDAQLNDVFFKDLDLPPADIELGVGSGSHAEQTGHIMIRFERECLKHKPDLVLVVGDVNSTLACALSAKKLGIPVAHVEAGLRSRDLSMPEEINRLCTDAIADYLFTTDTIASENLRLEGIADSRIHFVGNVMIDTLMKYRPAAIKLMLTEQLGLVGRHYGLVTLHRPSNVSSPIVLEEVLESLKSVARHLPLIFPLHPRTERMVRKFGFERYFKREAPVEGVWATEPMGYLEFLHLMIGARLVLTDSGGIQEETTVLGIPCLTLRDNSERPITCTMGTNRLVGRHKQAIERAVEAILNGPPVAARIPEKWDGRSAERMVEILVQHNPAGANASPKEKPTPNKND